MQRLRKLGPVGCMHRATSRAQAPTFTGMSLRTARPSEDWGPNKDLRKRKFVGNNRKKRTSPLSSPRQLWSQTPDCQPAPAPCTILAGRPCAAHSHGLSVQKPVCSEATGARIRCRTPTTAGSVASAGETTGGNNERTRRSFGASDRYSVTPFSVVWPGWRAQFKQNERGQAAVPLLGSVRKFHGRKKTTFSLPDLRPLPQTIRTPVCGRRGDPGECRAVEDTPENAHFYGSSHCSRVAHDELAFPISRRRSERAIGDGENCRSAGLSGVTQEDARRLKPEICRVRQCSLNQKTLWAFQFYRELERFVCPV